MKFLQIAHNINKIVLIMTSYFQNGALFSTFVNFSAL